jgi:hypothetical protein
MVVNFRARGISRGTCKLTRTPTLNKKKNSHCVLGKEGKKSKPEKQVISDQVYSNSFNFRLDLSDFFYFISCFEKLIPLIG